MIGNKFKISRSATNKLVYLKSRTSLTPNILCRIGFCLSLSEAQTPDSAQYPEDGMEFNRYTLLGDYEPLFLCLLREKILLDGEDPKENLDSRFRGHMNRGVALLSSRVRSLPGILEIMPNLRG